MTEEKKPRKRAPKKPENRKVDLKGGGIEEEDYGSGIEGDVRITFPKQMSRSDLKKKLEFMIRKL
jgi:hypothetical protein